MRLLGIILVLALILYVRSEFGRVSSEVTNGENSHVPMLKYEPPQTPFADVDGNDVVNGLYPQIINTEEYERIGAQAAADDAMRQARAAQDQAWMAEHPDSH